MRSQPTFSAPRRLLFLLVFLSLVCGPAHAQTWQPLVNISTFGAPSASGAAGSTTGAGNSFVDVFGGVASVNGSNQLVLTPDPVGGNMFLRDLQERPAGETFRDSEQVVQFKCAPSTTNAQIVVLFRLTGASVSSSYGFFANAHAGGDGQPLLIIGGGSFVAPTVQTGFPTLNATDVYSWDFKVSGASPTTFAAVLSDVTTGTVLNTATFAADSTAGCQAAGRNAISIGNGGSTNGTVIVTGYRENYNNSVGMTVSPATVAAGASPTTFTLAELGAATWTPGTPGTPVFGVTAQPGAGTATKNGQSVSSASAATVSVTPAGGPGGSLLLSDAASGALGYVTITPVVFAVSPSTITAGAGNTTFTVNGSGLWASGSTPLSVTNSNGASATLVSQTYVSAFQFTAVVNPGSSGGTFTVADSASSLSQNVLVIATIPVSDPNVFFSPYGTYSDGSGALGAGNVRASSTYAQWTCDNNYLKTVLNGTVLTVNITASAGWHLFASVDDGPYLLTTTVAGAQTIPLGAGLTAGAHRVYLFADYDGAGEAWTPALTLYCNITGLTCDGASSPPTLLTGRAFVLGDSYRVGVGASLPNGVNAGPEASLTDVPGLMRAMGCEYGSLVGQAGGYIRPTMNNTPPVDTPGSDAATSWNKFHAGAYRTFTGGAPALGGQLLPFPTLIVNFMGYNDGSGAALRASVSDWLTTVRAAAPSAALFTALPMSPARVSQRADILAATQAANDPKAYCLDAGLLPGLGIGTVTGASADGIHPNTAATLIGTAAFAAQMATKTATGPVSYARPPSRGR